MATASVRCEISLLDTFDDGVPVPYHHGAKIDNWPAISVVARYLTEAPISAEICAPIIRWRTIGRLWLAGPITPVRLIDECGLSKRSSKFWRSIYCLVEDGLIEIDWDSSTISLTKELEGNISYALLSGHEVLLQECSSE